MRPVLPFPRRWKPLVLRALAATALSILALQSACARSEDSPWTPEPRPVTEWRKKTPHRLAVVYWPALRGCTVCDSMLIEKLDHWIKDREQDGEIVVATVVPADSTAKQVGVSSLPGQVIQVASAEYSRAASLAPRPRIEIWSATGELLLLRTIPSFASQVEMLDEELLAARWFTKPLAPPAAGGGGR